MPPGGALGSEVIARLIDAYAAFNRADFDRVVAELRPTDGFEFVREGFGGQGAIAGPAAFRHWMEPDAIEGQRIEPSEIRVCGDRVLVRQRGVGTGASSGIEVSLEAWSVWTFDERGDLIRLEAFTVDREADAQRAAAVTEPVASDSVALVRRTYERMARTGEVDFSVLDAEIEWDNSLAAFDGAIYHGHQGVSEFFARSRDMWDRQSFEPQQLIAVRADRVLVTQRIVSVGRDGIETVGKNATVFTFRGGKIVHMKAFQTTEEALGAAG